MHRTLENELRPDGPPKPERPVMVFDGDCRFCRFWIERWRDATGDRIEYHPLQAVAARYPEIPRETFEHAVQLIEPAPSGSPSNRVTSGADAVFRTLEFATGPVRLLGWLCRKIPGALPAARLIYRFIARHRTAMGRVTRWLWGTALGRPTFYFARWLFMRLLGLAFFFAFVSLLVQIKGLAGSHGIVPADRFLKAVGDQLGPERYHLFPTLFWFGVSDAALVAVCLAGVGLSVLMFAGWWPSLCLLAAWGLYLSLAVVCQTFLNFQWDALLLETALLAIFLAPPFRARPALRDESFSARMSRWLLLWLLFRLMFESGAVKLASGDPTWAWNHLTALGYHFETQPLPLPAAWWAHHAPLWAHRAATAGMFAVELGMVFCIFLPRRLRLVGFLALIGLQGGIAATGNYAFFNFLSAALCVLMLEDSLWPRRWRKWIGLDPGALHGGDVACLLGDPARPLSLRPRFPVSRAGWPVGIVLPVAALSLIVSGMGLARILRMETPPPRWMERLGEKMGPLRSFNSYGLFAVMTTTRPEIVVEGSNDGEHWLEYEFRWKPGELNRMPPIVAPHQPRLDWQMWFAALGTLRQNPWFLNFLSRLLEGSPEVLALLGRNPFPDAPPRYVRAVLYEYHFTQPGEGKAWWKRERIGLYCPSLMRR